MTDGDWLRHLAAIPAIDEVNFRQPSGSSHFRALAPGEVFLLKLHSPRNVIAGGGIFAHMSLLPVSLAWEVWIPVPADWSANIAQEVPRRAPSLPRKSLRKRPSLRGARAAAGGPGNEAICPIRGRLLRRPAASSQ